MPARFRRNLEAIPATVYTDDMDTRKTVVVGGGAWGTALAAHACRRGHTVAQWLLEPDLAAAVREKRENPKFLPGILLPAGIEATSETRGLLDGAAWVLSAVPGAHSREVYRRFRGTVPDEAVWVTATKGIEPGTDAFPSRVVEEELERPALALSGPTFAREVASGLPAAVVIAGEEMPAAAFQHDFSDTALRVYTNEDLLGVQLAGSLKNVIAIAAGLVEGLGMGTNCTAALITRGLAEMARLGAAMGAQAATFHGLAGMGDLVLTCTGSLSRNRTLGIRLGGGERLEDVLASTTSVAEGVRTVRAAVELAQRHDVEMPIAREVHRVLHEGGEPRASLERLMRRPLTAEDTPVNS